MDTRRCKFCNEEFIPKSNRQIYCDKDHWRRCPSCGKMYIEKFHENLSRPPRLCSPRCGSSKNLILPEFEILDTIRDYIMLDSRKPRDKYTNLAISKWFTSQNKRPVHVFPEDNENRIQKWCTHDVKLDSSEFMVYKLNPDYVDEFLQQNSIFKYKPSDSISLGLVKNSEIFQVLSFSSPRYNKLFDYEISQECTKLGYEIIGGLDALSSQASLKLGVANCITYVDLSKEFSSSKYKNIGMRWSHTNVPRLRSSGVFDCGTEVLVF